MLTLADLHEMSKIVTMLEVEEIRMCRTLPASMKYTVGAFGGALLFQCTAGPGCWWGRVDETVEMYVNIPGPNIMGLQIGEANYVRAARCPECGNPVTPILGEDS